ncbi:hypothetical protein GOODEAATRI_003483 [Goodea atripinnis]|uniref:Protein MON2 homolog n=1 Tax=Goodea atripinnis TaxID=208336 RepID=A0ABV0PVG4_9TELE
MVNASWCGLLAALSLLLDASTDEAATENILKAEMTMASLCGRVGLVTPRDAFITAICKASLPPHYALTVLSSNSSNLSSKGTALKLFSVCMSSASCKACLSILRSTNKDLTAVYVLVFSTAYSIQGQSVQIISPSSESHQQVVAVGQPLTAQPQGTVVVRTYLDDVSLHHLINALCSLSLEAMEMAYGNNKLLLLNPLKELSNVLHADIRQKQLECVLQILQSQGDSLGPGWPLVLGVIGAIRNDQGESLIRTAFQCLQLVVTDFLPTMPCTCLQIVVDVAGSFGLQNQELNISLTSIGLLWNISDYFFQRGEAITQELEREEEALQKQAQEKGETLNRPFHPAPPFDCLWLCLYAKLGELCVDPRPAVRKSAGQTLFSTIAAHGTLLQQPTWHIVVWKVTC